jgi:type IV pilus assembly protein PilQ
MLKIQPHLPAALGLLLLALLAACRSVETPPRPEPPPRVRFDRNFDPQIKEIFDLARRNRWEEADKKAAALVLLAPMDASVIRLQDWVTKQQRLRRDEAMENQIREIDAKNSPFNPTLKSLFTEQKDRGLPPRKDIRDTVDKIESQPWIPPTYGKTITQQGPLFEFESASGRMAKVLDKEVTIHLENVPMETLLLTVSQSSGINFVADKALPPLKALLTVHLDRVKLSEFLRYLGRNYDLQFQIGSELVWVVDAKDPKKLMEETRFYRLRKGFVLPAEFGAEELLRQTITVPNVTTINETQKFHKFVNDQAPRIPSLERAITNLFGGSKYMIDYERNLVMAKGTPEQLDVLEKIIKEFDQAIQQVLIEARFVTISKPAFMQLGVIWETERQKQSVRAPQDFTGLINSQNLKNLGTGIQYTFTNILDTGTLSATISALEQMGESQTLSAPRLTVLNNLPATISDGKVQYYYEEYTVKSTVQQYYTSSSFVPQGKPTKITAGAVLHVMASISGDGNHIILALNPTVNTDVQMVKFATVSDFNQDGDLQNTFDINLPQYRTQELATRVVVRSGETVVMGGVLERQRSTFVESVPVLGDLPLIGALFRRRTEVDQPRYLLVFVTATLVGDGGEFVTLTERADAATAPATTPPDPAPAAISAPAATNSPPATAAPIAPTK